MANGGTDRARDARTQTIEDAGGWQRPAGKVYRCQVYVYPREGKDYLAVAAALPGVAGTGATEADALTDITRAFRAIIPLYTADGRPPPWLNTPPGPEPGGVVRWVFPEV